MLSVLLPLVHAATLEVPSDHNTIAEALAAATDGDEIEVAPGTYCEAELKIQADITLRGSDDVLISGACATHEWAVEVASGLASVRLHDLTIDGQSAVRGIEVDDDSSLYLERVTILHGKAEHGGAVQVAEESSLHCEGCILCGNTAEEEGGAIYSEGYVELRFSQVALNRVTIGGISPEGGGVFLTGGGILVNNTFAANSAPTGAGALRTEGETYEVTNNIFDTNVWGDAFDDDTPFVPTANTGHNNLFFSNSDTTDASWLSGTRYDDPQIETMDPSCDTLDLTPASTSPVAGAGHSSGATWIGALEPANDAPDTGDSGVFGPTGDTGVVKPTGDTGPATTGPTPTETGLTDTGRPTTDTAPTDTAPIDTVPIDTAASDTGRPGPTADTAVTATTTPTGDTATTSQPVDSPTGAVDSGPADTGSIDTGVVDTAIAGNDPVDSRPLDTGSPTDPGGDATPTDPSASDLSDETGLTGPCGCQAAPASGAWLVLFALGWVRRR